jgi:hypothetical protein
MTDIDEYDDEERAAYDDDLAAQNAVDDAKWDAMTPEQEEPPEEWHQDAPTHYALAEELIETVGRMQYGTNESRETLMLAQVRATLAMTDQLADALSIFRHSRQMTRTCSLEHPVLDGPFGGTDAEGWRARSSGCTTVCDCATGTRTARGSTSGRGSQTCARCSRNLSPATTSPWCGSCGASAACLACSHAARTPRRPPRGSAPRGSPILRCGG